MFNPKICESCKYSVHMDGTVICDYICNVGHMRGCYKGPVCDKYDPKPKKRRLNRIAFGEGVAFDERI